MAQFDELLKRLYYTPRFSCSFSSVKKLYDYAKRENPSIRYSDVRHFLKGELVYTIHKPATYNFKRNKVVCVNIHEYSFSDLIDYSHYKNENDGYSYILCVIDGFSRLANAHAMKRKDGRSIRDGLDLLFPRETPVNILTDNGKEYKNSTVAEWCRENSVNLIAYADEKIKSSLAERLIRTLKTKIHKFFSSTGKHRWIDVLSDIVDSYNNSYHRVIKMRPIDVTPFHRKKLLKVLYNVENVLDLLPNANKSRISRSDAVRLVRQRATFHKGYQPTHTEESFTIVDKYSKSNQPMFTVKDKNNELIKGKFYEKEMQSVLESANTYFRIEKILSSRRRHGKLEYKVRWLGYGPLFDSYVSADEVANFKRLTNGSRI